MGEEQRDSGIDVIGAVPWGSHFCQFYQTAEDLLDTLVPYFKAGLEANEFCMWVTAVPVGPAEALQALRRAMPDADRYLESGQLEVVPYTDWYLKGGSFDSERVLSGWVDKLDHALANGYKGLRLTGNTFWLEKEDWQSFADYEQVVDSVIHQYRMLAICTYAADRCGVSEVADVVSSHQFALIKRLGRWEVIESAARRQAEEERDRLTEEIDAHRRLFQTVVDNAPVGIAVLRAPDLVYELANPTFQAIAPGKVMIGKPYAEVWPEMGSQVLPIMHDVLRSGEIYRAADVPRFLRRAPDGPFREAYLTFAYVPMRVRQHTPDALLVLVEETTEQVLARRKLEELAAEAERQAEAAERRAAELDAANKELEAFSYTVSHDLRAPLRAIDGFSRILREEFPAELTGDGRRYLQLIRDNTLQMAELIDDLLTFSRLSRQSLQLQRVALGELVRDALAEVSFEQNGRRVEITVGDLPECEADRSLLRQVFANLLDNALKFTRSREVATIQIGATVETGSTIYYVRDNGVGFDPQYSDQLFRVFHRLHTIDEFEGTGIGLATVQRIVQRHGGRIWAEGAVGQGATFYFTL